MKKLTIILLVFITASCSRNPVTGKKEVMLMSKSQEIAIGKQNDPAIVAQFGLYEDAKIQNFIKSKGDAMAKVSHMPDLEFHFKILDSPVVNAFALPGGYVYFTRGIMAHFNNEAQFAGVLGHEIGHVTARHSAKQYTKQMFAQVGLMAGLIASEKFRNFANEANQGLGLLFLKFGRDAESQSDELGVEYSTAIKYDSHQMADFFETLERLQKQAGQSIPDFLSTHPNPADRHNKVHELTDEIQKDKNKAHLRVNRESYLRMIDGMIYGEDPRQGYVENNVFYHPELKFEFPVPANWQLANSPAQVQMAPKDGQALMIFTVAQGQSLDEVAQKLVQENQFKVINSQRTNINGLSAISMLSEQTQQDQATGQSQTLKIQSSIIKYGNLIYVFHGLSDVANFGRYHNSFKQSMNGFKQLNDPSKINVKPDRLDIVAAKSDGTVDKALRALGVNQKDLSQIAILNGMELNDQIKSGELLKIITK